MTDSLRVARKATWGELMKRIQGLAGLGIAVGILVTSAPAAAAGVPDATCTVSPGVLIIQNDGEKKVAQTFTAIHSGGLDTAQMMVGNPIASTPGDWRLEVATTSGGLPGAVVASTTVANTLAPGAEDAIAGTFPSPATVTAGTLYALLVSRPGSSGYEVSEQGGDPCPGQGYYQNMVAGPFVEFPSVDFGFATTVQPATPVGTNQGKKCKKKKHKKHAAAAKKHKKCKKKKRK
jgi:hypothetical protein